MKTIKKIIALCLSAALLTAIVPQTTADAATKVQKETLLTGETVNYSPLLGTIKTVSSSKKAVATVKKKDGKAVVTAKKAGKATITIKSTRGTNKINLTIKKADFKCSVKELSDGYALISVKNNTSIFVDSATVAYVLKNPEGEILYKDTCSVSDLMPKQTAYHKVYYSSEAAISAENSEAYVVLGDHYRSLTAKYKSRISSTNITITEEDKANNKLTYKLKNNYSGSISGTIDFFFYDAAGNITNYTSRSVYLKGKALETNSLSVYDDYSSYSIKIRTYSKLY